jgi:hypothetical protein
MKKIITGLLATLLLLTLSVATFGHQDQAADKKTDTKKKAPSNNTNFVGEITAGSASSITVKTKSGDKTAAIDDKTKIKHEGDGSAATAADLKVGERAHIWATKDKAGNWTATTIRVGKLAPKKDTKKETTKKAG